MGHGARAVDLRLADVRRRLPLLVDDLGGRFRYHDLLRDHLRAELRRDPSGWRRAHQRAAAASSPGPERIEHLLEAGDDAQAADEISELSRVGLLRPALADRVLDWAERLDPEVRAVHPWVDLAAAAALANRGRLDQASTLLESVAARAGEDDFELRWLALRFTILATRDYARLGPALQRLEADPRYVELPVAARVEQAIGAAWTGLWTGQLDAARRRVEEATSLVRRSGDLGAAEVLALHHTAMLTAWPGGPEALAEYARCAIEALGDESAVVRIGARLQSASAELLTGSGPAVVTLSPVELGLVSTVPYWACQHLWLRAVGARARDDPAAAAASVVDAEGVLATGPPEARALWATLAPLAASALREIARPAAIARLRWQVAAIDAPDRQLHGLCVSLIDAEAAWADGQVDLAEATLREVVERSHGIEAAVVLEASAELAVLLAERRRSEDAVGALEALLDRVAPAGTWMRVAQSGHGLAPVLRCVGGARRAAAASVLALLDPSAPPEPRAVPGSPEVLTSREMEVLRMLASGASNQEIGTRLYLSENTVKTHVKRVLAKLSSPSRTAAAARARELGLL